MMLRSISIVILMITLALCCCTPRIAPAPPPPPPPLVTAPLVPQQPRPHWQELTLNGVLSWRGVYGDLLGKPKETVLERFGPPNSDDGQGQLEWGEGEKTGNRSVTVFVIGKNVHAIKVFAREDERLDPIEAIKNATLFTFQSGTFQDAASNYFIAETKDGRNSIQFYIGTDDVRFHSMIFTDKH